MTNLFKAFLFKLRHDLAFKITLIIGAGLAVMLSGIYLLLDIIAYEKIGVFLNGENMLISSLSPAQNFGLAIPINLLTFTVLEFNQGCVRNKIIAGNSKAKIYTSIFLTGLVFAFALIIVYASLCFGIGAAFGGVRSQSATITSDMPAADYTWKILIIAAVSYLSIVSFTIFFATLLRNIGPAIPIVIVTIVLCVTISTVISLLSVEYEALANTMKIINPLYAISATELGIEGEGNQAHTVRVLTDFTFISGIISNICYASLFFAGGLLIFQRRDVK